MLLASIGTMFNCMLLASLCLTAAAMFDTEFDLPWAMWKRTYNKNYETQVGSNVTILSYSQTREFLFPLQYASTNTNLCIS